MNLKSLLFAFIFGASAFKCRFPSGAVKQRTSEVAANSWFYWLQSNLSLGENGSLKPKLFSNDTLYHLSCDPIPLPVSKQKFASLGKLW
jgi:hypothetical protein